MTVYDFIRRDLVEFFKPQFALAGLLQPEGWDITQQHIDLMKLYNINLFDGMPDDLVLVKSGTTAYREAKVQSVTCLIQLPRRRPRPPPSPQGVGSSFPFGVPADHMLKYSQPSCRVRLSQASENGLAHAISL